MTNPITTSLGIITALCAALAGLFFYLYQAEVAANEKFHSEVAASNATVAEANRQEIAAAEQNTRVVAEAYVRYAADIERAHVSRFAGMQREASRCATATLVAGSIARPDGGPADTGLDTAFTTACERLEQDCAKTTLQTIHLQSWVRRVCK